MGPLSLLQSHSGLSIIKDGEIAPSPGIAGHGVYAFGLNSLSDADLEATWERTRTGGCPQLTCAAATYIFHNYLLESPTLFA